MKATSSDHTNPDRSFIGLDALDGLEVHCIREDGVDPVKTKVEVGTYRGRSAVRMVNDDGLTAAGTPAGAQSIAIVKDSEFGNGTIELDVVGRPREGAPPSTRGFVGIAFRVQEEGSRYESIYLRSTNGRAEDQLLRNHTTQYVSQPEFSWQRLRKENPGVYESYVDVDPVAWTKMKVVVDGSKARLHVNDTDQPCLIVDDLKLGELRGKVALWTGSNSDAFFSNLLIRRK